MKAARIITLCLCAAATPVYACDAPGTPNPVSATAINSSTIQLKMTNTAKEGTEHAIWFLIQDFAGNVQRFTRGRILDGDFAVYSEVNLMPKQQYCFRVWTRDDSIDGCRSEQPSGYVCAITQAPFGTLISSAPITTGPSTPPQPTPISTNPGTGTTGGGGSCCNETPGSDDAHCCSTGALICPTNKKFYCSSN